MLLLDEITANVDGVSQEEIVSVLSSLNKEHGLTIISISHRSEMLQRMDEVFYLEGGRLSQEKICRLAQPG